VAGTYFNNANANSIAADIFKDLLLSEGKAVSDEELAAYGGLNDEEFLCEYLTKDADAGARRAARRGAARAGGRARAGACRSGGGARRARGGQGSGAPR
jgi:hypothetical protein